MNTAADTVHVPCAHCGATNRIPAARLAEDPVCGRCGAALLDGRPIELTDADFDRVAGRSDLPVVVDFWAPWCGPCRQMAPQFAQAAGAMKGRALFVKVNSDDSPRTAARFGIRSIPTLVKLQRGDEVARVAGARPAGQIVQFAGG
ncbi:MAG TPA: thioredoxin TrxC [Rubrivivax sp.]|nr:thioredoxin TrxC [Rubrivivax sp.]